MKLRRYYVREPVRQCARWSLLVSGLLTSSLPALAQPDDGTGRGPDAPAEPALAEPAPAEPGPAEPASAEPAPAEPALAEPALAEPALAEPAPAEPGPAEPAPAEPAPPKLVPPKLALELLPPTAYPNRPNPGIPGGSLSLVMGRLQWPYMPRYGGDEPALRVGFSGFGWLDSSYRKTTPGLENTVEQTEYQMQGRFGLRVTPVYNVARDYFVQANVEFIANANQDHTPSDYTDIDDAYLRAGKWKHFDFQIGRFQGFEVYHYGMGLDQNTFERQGAVSSQTTNPPIVQPYGLSDLWDRGLRTGGAAIHWYYPEWLRLELLARYGVSSSTNDIGIRPVAVLDFGWLKAKGGYERRLEPSLFKGNEGRTETQGVGGELQFVLDPWVELGGGVAQRVQDNFASDGAVNLKGSTTTWTYGGFLNVRPYFEGWLVGLGYHHTDWENLNYDAFGEPENQQHDQMFAALQYILWEKLIIKYVFGYAKAHVETRNDNDKSDTGFENESLSHRLRFMILY